MLFRSQHFTFPYGHCTHHDLGVLIMDRLAIRAPVAGAVIPFRDTELQVGIAAMATEFHEKLTMRGGVTPRKISPQRRPFIWGMNDLTIACRK